MAGNTEEALARVQAEAASAYVNTAYKSGTVNKLAIRHE